MSDLKNVFLWIALFIIVVGVFDTLYYGDRPTDNEEENIIVRPSYDHSSLSVFSGKQE